jgi:hypothetical protein
LRAKERNLKSQTGLEGDDISADPCLAERERRQRASRARRPWEFRWVLSATRCSKIVLFSLESVT